MKKVLIANLFHASPRIPGLAKYLPEFGWEPIILTPKLLESSNSSNTKFRIIQTPYRDVIRSLARAIGFKTEKGIKNQIKKKLGVPTYKNKKTLVDFILLFIQEIIAYPDFQKGWYRYAIKAGNKLLQQEKIDAIISSSPPVTCHLIAKELKMRHKTPWIADLRDLWTQNHNYQYSPFRKFIERKLEVKTLAVADALVTVSQPLAEKLKKLHKGEKIYVITNGFDPDEKSINNLLSNKFLIVYTGTIYRGKQDPEPLFKALRDLLLEGVVNRGDVKIEFYGNYSQEDWLREDIEKYGLQDIVEVDDPVPREEALRKQRESQLLLLLTWNNPNEKGLYTGKLFEYLAARRPILAIGVSDGVVEELLRKTNAGVHAKSVEEIKRVLKKFYQEFKVKGRVEYRGIDSEIDRYSQKEMARKFAEALDTLTGK